MQMPIYFKEKNPKSGSWDRFVFFLGCTGSVQKETQDPLIDIEHDYTYSLTVK